MIKKRIGLFGGSFDPVHTGHIHVAVMAKEQFSLDEILVLIDKEPRGKSTNATYENRLRMVQRATNSYDFFITDKLTMQKEGRTYDSDDLIELIDLLPGAEFYMIVGLDAIVHFDKWEDAHVFTQNVRFIIAERPGADMSKFHEMIKRLDSGIVNNFRYEFLECELRDISSTQVRKFLSNQSVNDASDHLSPLVVDYISEQNLYTSSD